MKDHVVLITGATSGLGRAAAFGLAKLGAAVVMMARDEPLGEATANQIRDESGNSNVELLVCDLSSQKSIRDASEEFRRRHGLLNVLINNAGMFTPKRALTKDGLELMFATNYLGPFLLTHLLLDQLKAGKPARVINVTAPSSTRPNFDDLQGARKFSAIHAFGASKAGNLLFTFALARRLQGTGITVDACFPGVMRTKLMRQVSFPMNVITSVLNLVVGVAPERAAEGLVELALSDRFEHTTGQLIHKGKPMKAPFQDDVDLQERLWTESVRLAGIANG